MKFLRIAGAVIGVLLLIIVLAAIALGLLGKNRVERSYAVPAPELLAAAPGDAESLARGEHWSKILGCRHCHGENLGGQVFVDIPPFRAVAQNLTSGEGGVGSAYDIADWDRSIRHGVKPDGRAVHPIMPSGVFHALSDEDAADLIAHLRSVPPVDNALPETAYKVPLYIVAGLGQFDAAVQVTPAGAPREPAPERGATAAYGRYLSELSCVECHAEDLRGGPHPDPSGPFAVSLEPAASWNLQRFADALQRGVASDGHQMDGDYMPWVSFQHMTGDEVLALHRHLKEVFD